MITNITNTLTNHIGMSMSLEKALDKASLSYVDYANKNNTWAPISHTLTMEYVNEYWFVVISVILQKKDSI